MHASSHKKPSPVLQAKSKKPASPVVPGPGMIKVWEEDPEDGVLTTAAMPDPAKAPLAFRFPQPAPTPSDDTSSAAFRYWTAAEALRRGADFWAPQVPAGQWQLGPELPVLLDEGLDLNAYYDRQALNFFHGPSPDVPGGIVFSGESPDIVCHEMGHAILDSLKPQLFDTANLETAAFHESFGDMSAILSALQLESLRKSIVTETHGHLYSNSRLSRLAEQLGTALRAQRPDRVDPDCLRNAVNSFTYVDPTTLPPIAPAVQLSSEPHYFSRIFTGAFLEILAGMLTASAADPAAPTPDELQTVSKQMREILVTGIVNAPVVSNFFAEVAAAMVQACVAVNPAYRPILSGVFVRRAILSLQTAANMHALQTSAAAAAPMAMLAGNLALAQLDKVALPAGHYGLAEPLIVQTPSQPRRIVAMAARMDSRQSEPVSAVSAATHFVDALFTSGHVDYDTFGVAGATLDAGRRLKTHRIVRKDGALELKRLLFDCGLCQH